MPTQVTHSDIAQALQVALLAAQEQNVDDEIDYTLGFTLAEIREILGGTLYAARRARDQAIKAGTIVPNGRQLRINIAGERCRATVYRVVQLFES